MTDLQKYQRYLMPVITLIMLVTLPFRLVAQQDLPGTPDIIRVTIDHSDNGVLVQWEPSTDTTVDLYHIYRKNERDYTRLFTFSSQTYEYKINTSEHHTLAYTVTAEDTLDGISSRESLLGDNVHRAMTVSVEFDPCTPANLVTWSPYVGWGGKLSGYHVFRNSTEGPEDLGFVSPGTHSFTDADITIGNVYSYFIKAVNTLDTISLSTIDTIGSFYPAPPDFLEVDYVSVVDRSAVEVQFSADISGTINDFRVMRRSGTGGPYTAVAYVGNLLQPDHMIADQVPTALESYEYMVQSVYQPEGCARSIVISESLPRSSILLQGTLEDQIISLNWTPWQEYMAEISGYIIQRMSESGEFFDVLTVGPGNHSWNEPVQSLINGFQRGELRYRVLSIGISTSTGELVISESNVISLQVETHLRVPSAFTPGSNDMNFEFKPLVDFAPGKYVMVIYDRAGRKLFETTDPGGGWDGRFHGGDFVDEGVYVYYIQYTDYTGIYRAITGNVTVLYP